MPRMRCRWGPQRHRRDRGCLPAAWGLTGSHQRQKPHPPVTENHVGYGTALVLENGQVGNVALYNVCVPAAAQTSTEKDVCGFHVPASG